MKRDGGGRNGKLKQECGGRGGLPRRPSAAMQVGRRLGPSVTRPDGRRLVQPRRQRLITIITTAVVAGLQPWTTGFEGASLMGCLLVLECAA